MTNKRAKYSVAVGLTYDGKGDATPTVGVKGENLVADDVVRIARRFGVPVIERSELAKALQALEERQEIPEELFEAVAIILHEMDAAA